MTWRVHSWRGSWSPDQARVAAHLPEQHRIAVAAANGVGKSHLAADIAASFAYHHENSQILLIAPTNRQVRDVLWPQVWTALRAAGQTPDIERPASPRIATEKLDLTGFATDRPERLQGYHAENLLVLLDEASGLKIDLLNALEGIAVGDNNYIFAIGNPNTTASTLHEIMTRESWIHERISALTHPNITNKATVIPGATTYKALKDRIRDWCKPAEIQTDETFEFEKQLYEPNDEFRIRYLGLFPLSSSEYLIAESNVRKCVIDSEFEPEFVTIDVARTGGDKTIIAFCNGCTIHKITELNATDLMTQAQNIAQLIERHNIKRVLIDAAGLGIGIVDRLRQITPTPIEQFLGADEPRTPSEQKRYTNRRASSYGKLATMIERGQIQLPPDETLIQDIAHQQYRYTKSGLIEMMPKRQIISELGRSPDRSDAVAMAAEWMVPPSAITRQRRPPSALW
ncbi:putative Terminase B [Azospirillaceae bacterium]